MWNKVLGGAAYHMTAIVSIALLVTLFSLFGSLSNYLLRYSLERVLYIWMNNSILAIVFGFGTATLFAFFLKRLTGAFKWESRMAWALCGGILLNVFLWGAVGFNLGLDALVGRGFLEEEQPQWFLVPFEIFYVLFIVGPDSAAVILRSVHISFELGDPLFHWSGGEVTALFTFLVGAITATILRFIDRGNRVETAPNLKETAST